MTNEEFVRQGTHDGPLWLPQVILGLLGVLGKLGAVLQQHAPV